MNPVMAGSAIVGRNDGYFSPDKKWDVDHVLSAISLSPRNLVQELRNFRSSSDPARFLYFENGAWVDFEREVFNEMLKGFSDGKSTLEVSIRGVLYYIDFLRMVRVNSDSGRVNSIAWIDSTGKCFFPRFVLDDSIRVVAGVVSSSEGEEDSDSSSNSGSRKRKRDAQFHNHSLEECTDESPDVSSGTINSHSPKSTPETSPEKCRHDNLQNPKWENVRKVEKEDKFYKVVEKLFLTGMARSSASPLPVEITAVRKCMLAGTSGTLRHKAFQMLVQEMKSLRGQNCVRFGWYGTDLRDLESVLAFGLGTVNSGLLGSEAHGVGVHLSSPHFPYNSAMMAQEDENGERHVLLCRVVMSRAEQVGAGSNQSHPSSDEYDSGVDNLRNPKWYVIWGSHMNTHILPEYLVSFKISKANATSVRTNMQRVKKANVGNPSNNLQIHFPKMISEMKQALSPSKIQAIQDSYNRWEEGKMTKEAFIRFLRQYVGDKLLTTIIRKIRGY